MSGIIAPYSAAQITAEGYQIELMIRAALLRARTAIPVKVAAVYPGTGSPPSIGTVDVQPLVETVDGSGRLWSLGTVYGAPFVRLQGGTSAVVLDPQVGDIGLAVVCDRDITSVLATGAEAAPGSA
ncbi:MAG: baseplate assembly protein, partial [Steroidobacteraceae bacterium]